MLSFKVGTSGTRAIAITACGDGFNLAYRHDMSTDTYTAAANCSDFSKCSLGQRGNIAVAWGRIAGGFLSRQVERFVNSANTWTTLLTYMSQFSAERQSAPAAQDGCYANNGTTTSTHTQIDFLNWDSTTTTTAVANLAVMRNNTIALHSTIVAYFIGGRNAAGTAQTTVEKFSFIDRARTAATALATAQWRAAGIGNKFIGFACGGTVGATTASTQVLQMNYSTSATATTTALSLGKAASVGASNYASGYLYCGDQFATASSVVYRYNMNSRATATSTTYPTSARAYLVAGTCTPGVFGGGG